MSSIRVPTFTSLPQTFHDKKAVVLKHMAVSERWMEIRPASRLEVRPQPEMLPTGIPEVDAITGGLPRGCLTEFCGASSSGKTSVLLASMAAATKLEETCVLVDASDSFDPNSAAAAGVDFHRLLWIRCGASKQVVVSRNEFSTAGNSQHKELNYVLAGNSNRGEQRLEQVLKSTDLILQSGGFGLVVLDLAGIAEKFVRRIPLASWFRFQRAVEHTKTALLVVSNVPCAQTCAALALKFGRKNSDKFADTHSPPHTELLPPMQVEVELVRSRLERKPMHTVKAFFSTLAVRARKVR
jgi:hypothetical protein